MYRATIYCWLCTTTRVISFRVVQTCNEGNIDSEGEKFFDENSMNTRYGFILIENEFYLVRKKKEKFESFYVTRYLNSLLKLSKILFEHSTFSFSSNWKVSKIRTGRESSISLAKRENDFVREWKWQWRYSRVITLYYTIYSPLIEALARHVWTEFSRDGVISDQTSIKVETRCRAVLVYHPPRETTRINFPRT